MPDDYALDQTRIPIGGVMRCCHESVASEYNGKRVQPGDTSECKYCKEKFTLVEPDVMHAYPRWLPNWQMNPIRPQP